MYVNDVDTLLPWIYGYIAIAVLGAFLLVGSMAYYRPWRASTSQHSTSVDAVDPSESSAAAPVHSSRDAETKRAA